MSLTVICWLWRPPRGYRSNFTATHVNTLKAMVARHYKKPHRFICITDMPEGMDCETYPLWNDHARILNPWGTRNPSCYRRLKLFSEWAGTVFGPRFVSLDLDTVILDDMSPIWDVDVDFKIWGDTNRHTPYNGSMFMMKAGARKQVWEKFDPIASPHASRKMGYFGSDQAWIGTCLGPNEAKWTQKDGVYSYRNDIKLKGGILPAGAKIVMFHGVVDPWSPSAQMHPWVRTNYHMNDVAPVHREVPLPAA